MGPEGIPGKCVGWLGPSVMVRDELAKAIAQVQTHAADSACIGLEEVCSMIVPISASNPGLMPSARVALYTNTVLPNSADASPVDESKSGKTLDLEGIRVTLSALGKSKAGEGQKNQDIDDSSLPDLIKQMLKTIRDLKLQIEQKMAELQAAKGDRGMSPDEQQLRLQALQSELAMLNGALSNAYATLAKAMQDMQLSPSDTQTAMGFIL